MAAANSAYDPTVIAIEIIQSLQSQQATGAGQSNQPNQALDQSQAAENGASAATPESGGASPIQNSQIPVDTQIADNQAAPQAVETTANANASDSPLNDIGPFGWVGIGFLFCLVFALIINIYLKRQKKEMDVPPTKEQLEELAPGAMESQAQS